MYRCMHNQVDIIQRVTGSFLLFISAFFTYHTLINETTVLIAVVFIRKVDTFYDLVRPSAE